MHDLLISCFTVHLKYLGLDAKVGKSAFFPKDNKENSGGATDDRNEDGDLNYDTNDGTNSKDDNEDDVVGVVVAAVAVVVVVVFDDTDMMMGRMRMMMISAILINLFLF